MLSLPQMCQLTGVSRRTLQGYDKMGLLIHQGTTPGGYWLYDETAVERLAIIQLLRSSGFSRKELVEILPDPALPLEEMLSCVRASLLQRCQRLEQLLSQLDAAQIRTFFPVPFESEEAEEAAQ